MDDYESPVVEKLRRTKVYRPAWGRRINRWHDEVGPLHLLNEDNSPACGAKYFTMGGMLRQENQGGLPKCKKCLLIEAKRRTACPATSSTRTSIPSSGSSR